MKVLFGVFYYLIEFSKLFIFGTYVIGLKIKQSILPISFSLSFLIVAVMSLKIDFVTFTICFTLLAALSYFASMREKTKFYYVLFAEMFVTLLDTLSSSVIGFAGKNMTNVQMSPILLLIDSASLLLLLPISIYARKRKLPHLNAVQTILMVAGLAGITLYISTINIFMENTEYDGIERYGIMGIVVGGAVYLIFLMLYTYTYANNAELKRKNYYNLKYISALGNYYKALLDKETETKKFRHDVKSHFLCIREYIKNGQYEKAESYIDEIESGHGIGTQNIIDIVEKYNGDYSYESVGGVFYVKLLLI